MSAPTGGTGLPAWMAAALVFFTSFVVLVLEIVAGRLLAPYVGVTLETFTTIIGVVLAGIAFGTWGGGRLADRMNPVALLGPLLVGSGLLTFLVIPVIRVVGPSVQPGSLAGLTLLTFLGLFVPAAMLSAVSPTVVKIQLQDLDSTGAVVGSLSALGTAGALFGTFFTGFVLVAAVSSTTIVVGVGVGITLAGVAVLAWQRRLDRPRTMVVVSALVAGVLLNTTISGPCQVESAYFCARVVEDEARESGRLLVLDTLHHSYVDLEDPRYLQFQYAQSFADVIGAHLRSGPVDALHIGGGGFTFPRWIEATYPGSDSLVLELDPTLVQLVEDELGLVTGERLRVRTGDARTGVLDQADDAYDLVLGDAFGGLAVPWHLTTREFTAEIERVLRPEGVYIINVIDYPPLGFAKAETATLMAVFDHVAVVVPPEKFRGDRGGNYVLVASQRPLDRAAIEARSRARGGTEVVYDGAALAEWVGGATVLTDEFAPVDQLLTVPR